MLRRRQEFHQRYLEDNNEQDNEQEEDEEDEEEEKLENPVFQHNLWNPFDRLLERRRLHGHPFDPFASSPFENFDLYPFGRSRLPASSTNFRNPFGF